MSRASLVFTIFLAISPVLAEAGWYMDCPSCAEHLGGTGTAGPYGSEAQCEAERRSNTLPYQLCYSDGSSSSRDNEASRFDDLKIRFADLFNNLRQYDNAWERVDHLFGGIPPENIRVLDQWVDRLYVAAVYQKRYLRWKWKKDERYLDELHEQIRQAESATSELKAELANAPARLKDAEAQRYYLMALAKEEERVAASLETNSYRANDRFWESHGRAWAIYHLLPDDRKLAFKVAREKSIFNPRYFLQELQRVPVKRTLPQEVPSLSPLVAVTTSNWRSSIPTDLTGSIETKLEKIKDLGAQIDELNSHVVATRNTTNIWEPVLRSYEKDNKRLIEELRSYRSPIQEISKLADDFKERSITARINKERSAANALKIAACSIVWDHAVKTIVIPQIEKFLEKNRLLGVVRDIQLMDRIRDHPEEFIPKTFPRKDIERLIEVERKVIDIEANFESFALTVADSNVQGDIAESERLAHALFFEVNKRGIEVMHEAAGTMKGPLGKISRWLMENAPKD